MYKIICRIACLSSRIVAKIIFIFHQISFNKKFDATKQTRLSERLKRLGSEEMGAQLRAPLKPLDTILA